MRYIPYHSEQGELVDDHLQNPILTNIVESYLFTQRFIRMELPDNADAKVFAFLEKHDKNCVLQFPSMIFIWQFYFVKRSAESVKHRFNISLVQEATEQALSWIETLTKQGEMVLDWYLDLRLDNENINVLCATFNASNDTWYLKTKHATQIFRSRSNRTSSNLH